MNKFRGSTTSVKLFKLEGGNSRHLYSRSSAQESTSRAVEGIQIKQTEKGAEPQQSFSTVTVVERKFPSLTINHAPQQLFRTSISLLQKSDVNSQLELETKLQLLKDRRTLFKNRASQPISYHDTTPYSSPEDSNDGIFSNICNGNSQLAVKRPARHISVRKFDTFSTFEGTFDEDTGLGYLAGIDEDRDSLEDNEMSIANVSQDSAVNT